MFSCWEWETLIAVAIVVPLLIAFGWVKFQILMV